mgnify:CR=1 FL=1
MSYKIMSKFIKVALLAALPFALPQTAAAKEFKINWKRTISSGAFDQEPFFHWAQMGADGGVVGAQPAQG